VAAAVGAVAGVPAGPPATAFAGGVGAGRDPAVVRGDPIGISVAAAIDVWHGPAVDGIAAAAGAGRGFCAAANHGARWQGQSGPGDDVARVAAGGVAGAFGKVAAGTSTGAGGGSWGNVLAARG